MLVALLHKHINAKPIKRNTLFHPLSREHHHALLLCWKIRLGIKKNVEIGRIKRYLDWFYQKYLLPHFKAEELFLFPILGDENKLIKKALSEHQSIKILFKENTVSIKHFTQIEKELHSHIRFEERVLFNEIQRIATLKQLEAMYIGHSEEKFCENLSDPFWE
ncbi:MAG: hemerythrin domain-containing protein [bacterium]|nr:hemerythrin domain-containing protein [bacterium]